MRREKTKLVRIKAIRIAIALDSDPCVSHQMAIDQLVVNGIGMGEQVFAV